MRKKKYILYFAAAAAAAGPRPWAARGGGRPWPWRVLARHRCAEGDGDICVSRTADRGERGHRVRNRV